jgi:hypothetical protein
MPSKPSDDDLINAINEGTFWAQLKDGFGDRSRETIEDIGKRAAALHNAERADVLASVERGELDVLSGTDFFLAAHAFSTILPDLNGPPERVMAAVQRVVVRGGGDLAATQPNAALRTWFARHPQAAAEVIDSARDGDLLSAQHSTFAFEALADIVSARNFVRDSDGERRLGGITALGRVTDPSTLSRRETLRLFSEVAVAGDDITNANLLAASIAIHGQGPGVEEEFHELLDILTSLAGDAVRNSVARSLWAERGVLTSSEVRQLLGTLLKINPEHEGTIRELDIALPTLLRVGKVVEVIDFLAALLGPDGSRLKFTALPDTRRALGHLSPDHLSPLIVRWFLNGSGNLCRGLSEALGDPDLREKPLTLRPSDLELEPVELIFLCRKAIGWLLLHEHQVASILVSVLAVCGDDVARDVHRLLVDIVLRNYWGVRAYLEELPGDHPAKLRVQVALDENAAYLAAVSRIPRLKELRPSERHRAIERAHQADQMRKASTESRLQSSLFDLVHHSTVLYANRTISFVQRSQDGDREPFEMDLHKMGVSFELPRMEVLDPIGLQLQMLTMRTEQLRR